MSETSLFQQARIERILRQRRACKRIFLEETFKPKREQWTWYPLWSWWPFNVAGAVIGLAAALIAEDQPPPFMDICGGVSGCWLRVERHNTKAHDARGYDPSYTSISCDFKPVVTRQKDGKFLVEFETDLPR